MDFLKTLKTWDEGGILPTYTSLFEEEDSRLKIFFLIDYKEPSEKMVIKIWDTGNPILQWKIFFTTNIYPFSDKLSKEDDLDLMVRYQLLDEKIEDPRLGEMEEAYLTAGKPDKKMKEKYPGKTVPTKVYRKFIDENQMNNQKYFKPPELETLGDLNYIDFLCLKKAGFRFSIRDYLKADDKISKYILLTTNPELFYNIDFVADAWTVAFVPDDMAFVFIIALEYESQKAGIPVADLAYKIALAKNYRYVLHHKYDKFRRAFIPGSVDILDEADSKSFIRSEDFFQKYKSTNAFKRSEEFQRKEEERKAQEKQKRFEEEAKRRDEAEEREIQEQINQRERLLAAKERIRIESEIANAKKLGLKNSSFGPAMQYFGLKEGFTCSELKKAFWRKSLTEHPDKGGNEARFTTLTNYNTLLENICKK